MNTPANQSSPSSSAWTTPSSPVPPPRSPITHALNDVGWYASAYLLTICSTQLMWGKLYTFYSVKWVFLASLFIFELGSLVCGVAPTCFYVMLYYLPIWFQAIKDASAIYSGVMNLPMIISFVIASVIGYYVPFT
ncbi:hypothetical protein BO78DRAFT_387448 [Aspergillus sclerotiicarbonarius CBS 121057]|uniref:Uncharacterized protein n=1 Tax=Aspergillus sclerotiicarbonarius (strain CBS 121057 / IBT 28362) TaxID=1448318 RepID=A0A319EGY6_ASPSB|nr:hypothetical protein BO78DRAFT_387448 [Aspergillus sclerotiicarbonarius CBS 121057]